MKELVFVSIFVIILIYLLQNYGSRRSKQQLVDKLPGPKSYPLIGTLLEFLRSPRNERFSLIEKLVQEYGYLFRTWVGPTPVVHVANPNDAEIILSSRYNISKSLGYEFLEPWLGTGLLTSTGLKWHKRRKMLTPAFHFSILETFFPVLVENSEMLLQKMRSNLALEEFDVFPIISKCTLDIICETAMGVKLNSQSGDASEYIASVHNMNKLIVYKIQRPWLWVKWIYAFTNAYREEVEALKILHSMSLGVIQERKQQRKKEKMSISLENENEFDELYEISEHKKRKAFLDLLLDMSEESNMAMSDEDIREEVDTFMFEGHDTTSSAISLAIYLLGSHTDIQDKVAEEIYSVCGSSECPLTMKNISQLKYLECVIKETLRIYPAVPLIARKLSEDVQLGGYQIPAATVVEINIIGIHRNSDHYPNPKIFNPDNFSIENNIKRHPYAFIPFSAGPRNCIGQKFAMMEEKVILASLLRKYKITATQKFEDIFLVPEAVLRPENGVKIKITERTW